MGASETSTGVETASRCSSSHETKERASDTASTRGVRKARTVYAGRFKAHFWANSFLDQQINWGCQ